MTKPQQQGALLAALAVVMIAVYARVLKPSRSDDSGSQPSSSGQEPPASSFQLPASSAAVSTQRDAQRRRAEELAWGRDPFARGAAAGQLGGLSLSGILWDATSPIAIINGQMLRVGEEIEGFRVVEIVHDRVSLSDGAQTLQLLIGP
jgi:hypothetical protein